MTRKQFAAFLMALMLVFGMISPILGFVRADGETNTDTENTETVSVTIPVPVSRFEILQDKETGNPLPAFELKVDEETPFGKLKFPKSVKGWIAGVEDGSIMETDATGKASMSNIPAGSYTLVEVKASKGFLLNSAQTPVTIGSGQNVELNGVGCLVERPLNDPIPMLVQKLDKDTNSATPSGGASLANAEFTVKYYDVITDNVTGLTPTRTWVFKTNANGIARYDQAYSGVHEISPGKRGLFFATKNLTISFPHILVTDLLS